MELFKRNSTSLAATLNNSQRAKGCIAYDPLALEPTYGYDPSLAPGIVFTVAFFLSMAAHVFQTIRSRKWWYSAFALGALGMRHIVLDSDVTNRLMQVRPLAGLDALVPIIARTARLCSLSKYPSLSSVSSSQADLPLGFTALIRPAPCFFSAGIYYILGQMINQHGRKYSPVTPTTYLYTFISFDVLSIIIQAVGGGMASSAGGKSPPGNTKPGTHVMMAGIIIQLVSMSIFGMLWLIFLWRARAERLSWTLVLATTFSAFCIIVRNFYRAIELSQGWKGYLITHEVYFAVLDGALMTLAVAVFNIFFPARFLSGEPENEKMNFSSPEQLSQEGLEPKVT